MTEVILTNLSIAAAVTLSLVYTLWVVHLMIDDASIIDLAWGAAFGLVAIALAINSPPRSACGMMLLILPLAWSIRYTTFICLRNLGHGEDHRYSDLRKRVANAQRSWPVFSFFKVYSFQGLAMIVVSAPLIVGLGAEGIEFGLAGYVGLTLWIFGFFFEAIGDLQLELFKKKHRNYDGPYQTKPVLTTGLWRYTRHPNYFGNACLWWGIGVVALETPFGWTGLIGPAFMNFALVYLTGKANNEQKMKQRPAYQKYIDQTSGFFPWFPKNRS